MALIADLMKGTKPAGKPPMGKPAGAMPDMGEDDGAGLRAAEDFLAASKSGDAASLLSAFKRLSASCESYEEDESTVSDTGAKRIVE